ncbi:MAG: hypothetical protein AB1478_03720 [Nitrospirota bacterium]
MKLGKRNFFKILFLIYFLLYVVSPICYVENRLNEDNKITRETGYDVKNVVFIWELIVSKLLQQENLIDKPSNVRFLIKKPRAVLDTDNITKVTQTESTTYLDDPIPSLKPLIPLVQLPKPDSQDGFYLTFSGLSPPSV